MLFLVFSLSCMIVGSSSMACSDAHCKDPALANALMEVQFMPNREQLGTVCPKIMSFLECERDFFECSGGSLEEMATSSSQVEAARAKAMLGGMSLARDLCDEHSSFHHDYLESIDCFRGYIEIAGEKCEEDIAEPIETFFRQIYPEEDARDVALAEIRCLNDAYLLACVVDNLGDTCGSVAQRVAMTALERMKAAFSARSCGDVENVADLKSRFLDFLELDENRRSEVQGIFDFFRRRR